MKEAFSFHTFMVATGLENTVYILHGQVLEVVTSAKYLGVDISNGLSWSAHIDHTAATINQLYQMKTF